MPHRVEEGYGVHLEALAAIARDGGQTVVTVDCGITAVAQAEAARHLGLELVDPSLYLVEFSEGHCVVVERHVPAAIQDYLVAAEPGARLMWFPADAVRVLTRDRNLVQAYLTQIFLHHHSWDADLIRDAIERGIDKTLGLLGAQSAIRGTAERLGELIELSIRATDIGVPIESEDFYDHKGISLSGELAGEEFEELEETERDEEVDQE